MAESILKYVQIESNAALIDSRVYCRDIIEVDHHYWYNDTLKKYQPLIESRFGQVRFETTPVLNPTGVANNTQKYALLTEAQCNLLLALSRNIGKVAEKKADLIADFETAKNQIRASLNRLLQPDSELEELKAENKALKILLNGHLADRLEFSHSINELHADSRIVSKSQVTNAIMRDFVEGEHYQKVGRHIFITDELYTFLMLTFRSKAGADISKLPTILLINRDRFFQFQQIRNKTNARVAQCDDRQLNLFGDYV